MGDIDAQINYFTSLDENNGVTYDNTKISYETELPPEPVHPNTVTVHYYYEKEQPTDPDVEIADPVQEEHHAGETFEISSPKIDGYTPNIEIVSGTMGEDDLEYVVRYTKDPIEEPDKKAYQLIIHYLYEDDTEAAPDYIEADLATGTSYEVKSPTIDGFSPSEEVITGEIADEDIEIIVRYTKVSAPDPTPPIQPDQPNPTPPTTTPEIPIIRNDDMMDSGLMFLSPLGVVAYVPNTGVVSSAIVPMFEQYFAEVILSQTFVMAVLVIFAVSFAVYFSLRRHLNLGAVTRRTPKRSYRSATKAQRKSIKKASSQGSTKNSNTKNSSRTGRGNAKKNAKATKSTRSSSKTKSSGLTGPTKSPKAAQSKQATTKKNHS